MICKYETSDTYISECDTGVALTGVMFPQTVAYNIYALTDPITGNASVTSYLGYCDAQNWAFNQAKNTALIAREATTCQFQVNALVSGDCPPGSASLSVVVEGIGTDTDIYQAYLNAFSNGTGALLSACTNGVAPIITVQPSDVTINAGENTSFSMAAIGSPILTYQWTKNGIDISSQTSTSISFTNVQITDIAGYSCRVSNARGNTFTRVAHLIVSPTPPVLTLDLIAGTFYNPISTSLTLTIAVKGSEPFSYQWYKDGVAIGGATSASFTIPVTQATDSGAYNCIISNTFGSVSSATPSYTFGIAPSITTQPVGGTFTSGATISLSVTVTGDPTLSYQWQKNGVNVGGAITSSLIINPCSSSDAGTYTCIISNNFGTVVSSSAVIVIVEGIAITSQPTNQTGVLGNSITFSVTATGSTPLKFRWYKVGNPFDTLVLEENISITPATDSYIFTLTGSTEGSYYVIVSNSQNSVTSNTVTALGGVPPVFSQQPSTGGNYSNGTAVSVYAFASNASYQWQKDGVDVVGQISPLLTINSFSSTDAGTYTCIATNAYGSTTSNSCVLNWAFPDICTGGVAFASSIVYTPASYAFDEDLNTGWLSYGSDKYIGYFFGVSTTVKWLEVISDVGDGIPNSTHTFNFQGWDGASWITILSWAVTSPYANGYKYAKLSNTTGYIQYRLTCNTSSSSSSASSFGLNVRSLRMNNS